MSEWIITTLGEISIIKMGQSPPSSSYNVKRRGLPFFQGKSEFTELHPIVKKWCDAPKRIADKGDILLSVRAPVGATNLANQKCAIGRGLAAISYQHCNKYLLYYLRYSERKLQKLGTGTTFKAISKSDIEEHTFPLPPLPEQRAIVARIEELFSRLDKGVETLQKVKEQLKVYRHAVLKWAFEGKLTAEWRKSKAAKSCGSTTTAEELLQQIKAEREHHYQQKLAEWQKAIEEWEAKGKKGKKPAKPKKPKELPSLTEEELSELPKLPNGWAWVKFIEFCELQRGYDLPLRNVKKGPYPVITSGGLAAYHNEFKASGPCLVTGRSGGVGNIHFFEVEKYWPHNTVLFVKDFHSNYPKYMYYFFLQFDFKSYSASTAVPTLDRKMLYNVLVKVPSLLEQQAIVQEIETRLSVADKLEQIIDETLQKAEALRQSILKKAFEGRLLSEAEREALKNDPEWEPAEKLLGRIKAEKEKQETKKNNKKKRK